MAGKAGGGGAAKRDRLAQRRKALGLTQETLADVLGVERSTVVRWERGETEPSPLIRPKLAKALQVPTDRLEELLASSAAPDGIDATPGTSRDRAPVVPRQLPAAAADFTGRAAELEALTRILDQTGVGVPGTVAIAAIGGTAGVGKTALALHWAHHVADRFSDGQLYVNLRGYDPSRVPAAPAEAIRGFLDALGIPPEHLPAKQDAQAGMFRTLVAERKMLIVLDNARDEHQVRPLLPASPASLVIVTSRNRLAGLAVADGARPLSLDVLTHDEATQLLTARIGHVRAAAEPDAIAEIATLCACLPLALAVAAARAITRPRFLLADLAAELGDIAGRLEALDSGDPSASVQAVFSWSYRQLGTGAARMFRLLGLHPGPDISVPAAASLTATSEPEARRLLGALTRDCLISEHSPGRYAFHDLLRAYAAACAHCADPEPDRQAATVRILDHYLHTSSSAALLIEPSRELITPAPPSPGVRPESLAGHSQASGWYKAEHDVLLAAVALAESTGFDRHAWQLSSAMASLLSRHGHFREWAATQGTALAAASRLGDTAGQAISSRLLADAWTQLGDHGTALSYYAMSLELCQRLGNRHGEAEVHLGLGNIANRQGRRAEALWHSEQALRLYQSIGHKVGEATMLNNIGWFYCVRGDYRDAGALCRRALALCAQYGGDPLLDSAIWDSLGYIEHRLSNFSDATACYERALEMARRAGFRWLEGDIKDHLGDTKHAVGELPQAREAWQQALAIFEDQQRPEADRVRAKLANTGD